MVGPQLGRETAESAYKIKRRLCVTALHGYYNQVGWKSGPAKAGPAGPATPPLRAYTYQQSPIYIPSCACEQLVYGVSACETYFWKGKRGSRFLRFSRTSYN